MHLPACPCKEGPWMKSWNALQAHELLGAIKEVYLQVYWPGFSLRAF